MGILRCSKNVSHSQAQMEDVFGNLFSQGRIRPCLFMSHVRGSSAAYEYWREGLLVNISNGAPFVERGRPGNVVSLLLISEGGSLVVGNPLPTPPP